MGGPKPIAGPPTFKSGWAIAHLAPPIPTPMEEMLENLGATDIQLIPHFALRLSSKYHANGSVVEAGVALLANTLLPVWSLSKKGKTIPKR